MTRQFGLTSSATAKKGSILLASLAIFAAPTLNALAETCYSSDSQLVQAQYTKFVPDLCAKIQTKFAHLINEGLLFQVKSVDHFEGQTFARFELGLLFDGSIYGIDSVTYLAVSKLNGQVQRDNTFSLPTSSEIKKLKEEIKEALAKQNKPKSLNELRQAVGLNLAKLVAESQSTVIIRHNGQLKPVIKYHVYDGLMADINYYLELNSLALVHKELRSFTENEMEKAKKSAPEEFNISIFDGTMLGKLGALFLKGPFILNQDQVNWKYVLQSKIKSEAKQNMNVIKDIMAYYKKRYNRNSYDNQNGQVNSTILISQVYPEWFLNAFYPDFGGSMKDNAAWVDHRKGFIFGAGANYFENIHRAADVSAHEFTHAVISRTSNLVYESESGALNESLADTFAALYTRDFMIGETAMSSLQKAKGVIGLRNMLNPTMGNLLTNRGGKVPQTYKERLYKNETKCDGKNDQCGVHTNSNVINRTNALVINLLGWEKSESIMYATMLGLDSKANFVDYQTEMITVCQEKASMDKAFSANDCKNIKDIFTFLEFPEL